MPTGVQPETLLKQPPLFRVVGAPGAGGNYRDDSHDARAVDGRTRSPPTALSVASRVRRPPDS